VPPVDAYFDARTIHYAMRGLHSSGNVTRVLIDSGASSSCIAPDNDMLKDLCVEIVDAAPNAGVKVGSAEVLHVVRIVNLHFRAELGFKGYRLVDGRRVEAPGELFCSNVLVVKGLDPDIILLSVRDLLERDGVQTYFNADNTYKVSNSLLLPGGVIVPFAPDAKCYELRVSSHGPASSTLPRAAIADDQGGARLSARMRAHAALGHAGKTRIELSNIAMYGKPVATIREPHECRACRLVHKGPVTKQSRRLPPERDGRPPSTFPGQRVYTDHSTNNPPGWPIPFTSVLNFHDDFTKTHDYMFTVTKSSAEVASALREYVRKHAHLFKEGKVYYWKVDNAKEYRGELIDGPDGAAAQLVVHRLFRVPHESNSNAKAERSHGVLARGTAACLAHAEAPACVWPWAAAQVSLINHFLATTAHDPPVSPHEFLNPGGNPAEMGHYRVLFCDVTVALPPRDKDGKTSHTAAEGCYLGFDALRGQSVVYVPALKRIATFRVLDWCGENQFTIVKTIHAGTPVTYHQVDDMPVGQATRALVPRLINAGGARVASAGAPPVPPDAPTPPETPAGLPMAAELPAAEAPPDGRDTADVFYGAAVNAWCDDEATQLTWVDAGPRLPLAVALAAADAEAGFPLTVREAMLTPYWPVVQQAMEDEIHGKVEENKAWILVRREAYMRVLKVKWVLKAKFNPDGSLRSVKARLVACGYGQREGIDYTDVFAATLAAPSFRLLCAVIAIDDLETDQIDAFKAFTQADTDCKLFAEMPHGFALDGYVLKLNKALEGIKQGAHLWFNLNRSVLLKLGFVTTVSEPNLYRFPGQRIIVGVFADDILAGFHRSATELYKKLKLEYSRAIKIGDIAIKPASVFIGIELRRDRHNKTITLVQESYIEKTFERYKAEARECSTPYGTREETQKFEAMVKEPEESCIDRIAFLKLCGALVWTACMTRPETQFAVSFLCTFSAAPGAVHYAALLNVLGYLRKTKHLGITYGGKLRVPLGLDSLPDRFAESHGMHVYHDSSYGKGAYPWGGFVILCANAAIVWKASRAKVVPDSTAYAEMAVASKAAHAAVALRIIFEGIGYGVVGPTPLLGDNQAVRDIIVKNGASSKTRHFERAAMTVKRFYQELVVVPYLVGTKYMAADMYTKALDQQAFFALRDYTLNLDNGPGTRVVLSGQTARLCSKLLGKLLA
jgi:hypothetical protein